MKYLVTSAEMKEYDNNTIEKIGIPGPVLMERAALAVRNEVLHRIEGCGSLRGKNKYKVLIVTGSGNNGADGLAVARLLKDASLADCFQVSVCECGNKAHASEDYKKQRAILEHYDISYLQSDGISGSEFDIIIDGIFGVGLSRNVSDAYAQVITTLNQMQALKIAIDIPSGICGTTGKVMGCAFKADCTVTFGFGKSGLYFFPGAEYAGEVVVADIGIDNRAFFGREPEMFTYDSSAEALLPVRKADGNKGTFGKVLLIAGWENMAGAAIMSAKAVLQTGAGMLKVCCSEENRGILQISVPEAMYGSAATLEKDLQWADIVAIGPGLGQSKEAACALKLVLELSKRPVVMDADALNLLARSDELKRLVKNFNREIVMTPHPGELSRISEKSMAELKSSLPEVAKEVGLDYDSVMVCKDARTVVYASGKPIYLNTTGNSGMATAGSGDVLIGIIASLMAQGMPAYEAACTGVYLHGLAGDKAAEKFSEYGVTATKIISQIKDIVNC